MLPILGPDLSGQVHSITVVYSFWIARLVRNHSCSVSELQSVCFVHVVDDSLNIVLSVHNVRDSGVLKYSTHSCQSI